MDKVEKELQKVRDATGDTSVFPSGAEKNVTIDGEDKNLTANEYAKYAKQLGKEKYTLLKDAVNSDAYQNMSAGEKAKEAVETVSITIEQYGSMKDGMDTNGNGAVSQDEAQTYLDRQDFSKDQKAQLWNIINKSWKNNPYK